MAFGASPSPSRPSEASREISPFRRVNETNMSDTFVSFRRSRYCRTEISRLRGFAPPLEMTGGACCASVLEMTGERPWLPLHCHLDRSARQGAEWRDLGLPCP